MLSLDEFQYKLILLLIVFLLSSLSIKKKYLTLDGAILAYLLGLIVIFTSGIAYFLAILVAFLATNFATSYKIKEKIKLKLIIAKKPIRDWKNVLANGFPLLFFSLMEYLFNSNVFIFAFLSSTATFLSDTISTEIGVLSRNKPVLITNFKEVHTGRSGGISLLGTFSGLVSCFFFSIFSSFIFNLEIYKILPLVMLCSTLANIFDSFLGATIQGLYYCNSCDMYSEEKIHTCGNKCEHALGINFINNHVINFIAVSTGGLLALILSYVLQW